VASIVFTPFLPAMQASFPRKQGKEIQQSQVRRCVVFVTREKTNTEIATRLWGSQ
jgi:hypothetical protein